MAEKNHILIVCGEASGDLHAGLLARELFKRAPGVRISAVGGIHLREAGAEVFRDIGDLAVIGLFDVLKKLPLFFRLKDHILRKIRQDKPDAVILIDFSGFNLRLAKAINKCIPVIYYVGPQIWASRQGRLKTMRDYINKLIVIFPFEKEFYAKHGIQADYVGYPLIDTVKPTIPKDDFFKTLALDPKHRTVALLPGSRPGEINTILPVMLETCILIRAKLPETQFIIAKSPHVEGGVYRKILERWNLKASLVEGKTHDCLNAADFCLVASGTATLETAIMLKPFLIIYRMNPLNYLLYRPQVTVPFIGMANIVAGTKIVPEFIQDNAVPQRIAEESLSIITDTKRAEQMKTNLAAVKASLGQPGAASRAAHIILDFITQTN